MKRRFYHEKNVGESIFSPFNRLVYGVVTCGVQLRGGPG